MRELTIAILFLVTFSVGSAQSKLILSPQTELRIAPDNWFNDNRILLFNYGSSMEGVDVYTGRRLYETRAIRSMSSAPTKNQFHSGRLTKLRELTSPQFYGRTTGCNPVVEALMVSDSIRNATTG